MFGPAGHVTNCQLYGRNKANDNWCILWSYVILSDCTDWLSPATQVHFWTNGQVLLQTHLRQGGLYQPQCFTPPASMLHRIALAAQVGPCYTLLYYVILQSRIFGLFLPHMSFSKQLGSYWSISNTLTHYPDHVLSSLPLHQLLIMLLNTRPRRVCYTLWYHVILQSWTFGLFLPPLSFAKQLGSCW